MRAASVAVVYTGVANLASILAGLRRAGAEPNVVDDARSVADAARLVLPGVGSFEAAMSRLRGRGLIEPLVRRIHDDRPTLSICLGLQLLGTGSDESPNVAGLGLFTERATRFDDGIRVPQLGWNQVDTNGDEGLVQPGYAYFAHSYRWTRAPADWRISWAEHGGRFVAALERGRVLACQFHPELSGAWGIALMSRWLSGSNGEAAPC